MCQRTDVYLIGAKHNFTGDRIVAHKTEQTFSEYSHELTGGRECFCSEMILEVHTRTCDCKSPYCFDTPEFNDIVDRLNKMTNTEEKLAKLEELTGCRLSEIPERKKSKSKGGSSKLKKDESDSKCPMS